MGITLSDIVSFSHVVLEGTAYEVGRMQAEMLQADPQRTGYLTPTPPFLERYDEEEAARELAFLDRHCPGLREEVQGAADALEASHPPKYQCRSSFPSLDFQTSSNRQSAWPSSAEQSGA